MLISAMLGIDSRTTMDIDTTIRGFSLSEERLEKVIKEICELDIKDNVRFKITKIEPTREDDEYGGYRVFFIALYEDMPVNLKIDVTTGDKITHKEIKYKFNLLLEDRSIEVWSYNVETILAEKFETIIKRSVLGTRIRDFYDVYMLINTQKNNIDMGVLKKALISTTKHRGTFEIINTQWKSIIKELEDDITMQKRWDTYKKDNFYADGIEYKDLINVLYELGERII